MQQFVNNIQDNPKSVKFVAFYKEFTQKFSE